MIIYIDRNIRKDDYIFTTVRSTKSLWKVCGGSSKSQKKKHHVIDHIPEGLHILQ